MSLGYALCHPQRIKVALGSSPLKASFDDGYDVVMAALDVKNPTDFLTVLKDHGEAELNSLVDALKGLAGPGGPLGFIDTILTQIESGAPDLAGALDWLADVLIGLDPVALRTSLNGSFSATLGRIPLFSSHDLLARVKRFLLSALGVFEKPFLDGHDDHQAVRSYRAAAFLRNLLGPLIDSLDSLIHFDLRTEIITRLDALLALVRPAALVQLAAVGRFLKDKVSGILHAALALSVSGSISVTAGGPSPAPVAMVEGYSNDQYPSPLQPTWLWITDIVTMSLSIFPIGIFDWWRVGWGRRWSDTLQHLFGLVWQVGRLIVRATRGPKGGTADAPRWPNGWVNDVGFNRFMFSEWGAFFVQLFHAFVGSWGDIQGGNGDNWVLAWGYRILKYAGQELQVRAPYLVARALYFYRSWKTAYDGDNSNTPPQLRRETFFWLAAGAPWIISSIFGIVLGAVWTDLDINPQSWNSEFLGSLIICGILGAAAPPILWAIMPKRKSNSTVSMFNTEGGLPAALWLGIAVLLWILALSSFLVTAGVRAGGTTGIIVLLVVGLVVLGTLGTLDLALPGPSAKDIVFVCSAALSCAAFPGAVLVILWQWIIADGSDFPNWFDKFNSNGVTATQSPYKLPYSGSWMTGQGFHGIFSHTYNSFIRRGGLIDNHFAYDFNNFLDTPALAARGGIVVSARCDQAANQPFVANQIEVLHLDWKAPFDLGTDDERILSYASYLHLDFQSIYVHLSQQISQGHHIADIDSTGISAQKHLHFQVHSWQRHDNNTTPNGRSLPAGNTTVATVFSDSDLQSYRPWAHIDGKPHSLRFFSSDNAQAAPLPRPLWIWLAQRTDAPADTHQHRLLLTAAQTAGAVTAFTDVANGHFHTVTLTAADVASLLNRQPPAAPTVSTAAGHTHTLLAEGFDLTSITGAANANVDTPYFHADNAASVLFQIGVPPPAQLLARNPEPYDLLGQQLVLRVNGRATEWYPFGAHRVSLVGDVALDRAPSGVVTLTLSGGVRAPTMTTVPFSGTDPRAAALAANGQRGGGSGLRTAAGSELVVRLEPVLILETVRRGSTAQVLLAAADQATLGLTDGLDHDARGSGDAGDLAALDVNDLASRLQKLVAGLPAPETVPVPANLVFQIDPVTTALQAKFHDPATLIDTAVDFSHSSGRVAEVLGAHYDSAASRDLFTSGALPLATGSVKVDGSAFKIPLLATPSTATVPFSSFTPAGTPIQNNTLAITMRGASQSITFKAVDTTAQAVAARILSQAEGLRAWSSGNNVILQTVAAGDAVTLGLQLNGAALAGANLVAAETPAALRTADLIHDSAQLQQTTLAAAFSDVKAQSLAPLTPAFTATHAAGGPIALAGGAAITIAAPPSLLGVLGAVAGNTIGTAIPNTVALNVPGWIDVVVDGNPYRLSIEGEPARLALDVGAILSQPLKLTIDGALQTKTLAPVTSSLSDLVYDLNNQFSGLVARIAYRYAFEVEQHGDRTRLALTGAGQAAAGFLKAAQPVAFGRGSYLDAALGLASGLTTPPTPGALGSTAVSRVVQGPLLPALLSVSDPPAAPGADNQLTLSVAGGTLTLIEEFGPNAAVPAGAPPSTIFTGVPPTTTWTATGGFALPRASVGFQVTVTDAGAPGQLAETHFEIDAQPAHLTGVNPVSTLAPSGTVLAVTIVSPAGTVTAGADVSGASSAEALLASLQRDLPMLKWWLVSAPAGIYTGDSGDRLHVQTRGGGTVWSLQLDGAAAIAALGFDPARLVANTAVPPVIDRIGPIAGTGNVADGAAVTIPELRAIVKTAAAQMTQLQSQAFDLNRVADAIELRAAGRAVSLTTVPPAGINRYTGVTTAGGAVTVAAGPRDLDNGWLQVRVDGQLEAAAPIFGARARIQSPLPATPDADVAAMQAAAITISVTSDSVGMAPYTVAVNTLDALLDALAAAQPQAWFGRVGAAPGNLRIESRRRGTTAALSIAFGVPAGGTWPALGYLGFVTAATVVANGSGTVGDLTAVSNDELATLLARFTGASEQSLLQTDALATGIQVTARSTGGAAAAAVTLAASAAPRTGAPVLPSAGGVTLVTVPGRVDQIAETGGGYTAAREIDPGLQTILVNGSRFVSSLFYGNAARIDHMSFPSTLSALNGSELAMSVDGQLVLVTFAAVTSNADVVRQIERGSQSRLRARVDLQGKLVIETFHEGRTALIQFLPPVGTDARTLLTGGADSAIGNGIADDLAQVSATDFATAFNAGYVSASWADASSTDGVALKKPYLPYQYFFGPARATFADAAPGNSPVPTGGAIPIALSGVPNPYTFGNFRQIQLANHLRIRSQVDGCASSVIPLVDAPAFKFERSLQRAPAVRGSVVLPQFGAVRPISGTLVVLFDDNGPAADVAPPVTVNIDFHGEQYNGQQLADRLAAELLAHGVGWAAWYDDDVIVVETLTPGIAGSVELPAAGSSAAMGAALNLGTTVLKGRGWPGAGQVGGFVSTPAPAAGSPAGTAPPAPQIRTIPNGFRSKVMGATTVAAAQSWLLFFKNGGVVSPVLVAIAANDTLEAVVARCDNAMRTAGPGGTRVGLCKKGVDGALYIEAMPNFTVQMVAPGTAPGAPSPPPAIASTGPTGDSIWLSGVDLQDEPALELLPTDVLRTYRFIFDRAGDGSALADLLWVRPPTSSTGAVQFVPHLPNAHYLLAARAEASRADGYKPPVEMVVSSGVATIAGEAGVAIIHQVRYWAEGTSGGNLAWRLIGVKRTAAGESLPYFVNPL